ncbi:uncharacterized protein EV422DRAFT_523594 [Fimicolochytrium jonesii]|uniref:uncharacterized protein n=1 Tax=Fimicolochytrium jonesii TaxID=1396493 RepID=UPI0022FEB272|nr:uncharacterized protein EV422DRAFT_523594 [Fimicolochytrium jonesii]KAI8823165.1 hypothetical protein EV422DRAFT_523594 [Fimicolochytrium jonesii]
MSPVPTRSSPHQVRTGMDDPTLNDPGFNELVALDRGFKSLRLDEQIQSVLKFIEFFQKYDSASVVGPGFIKLAEYWRTSNNIVRQYIFKVIKHSTGALVHLSNADDVLRRIAVLLTSNDVLARTLTLRVLGYMAVIAVNNFEVHHGIRLMLDSKDSMEVEAALFAAEKLSFKSEAFCVNHLPKLRSMVEDKGQPTVIKLKVIRVFKNMYHHPALASAARDACLRYLISAKGDEPVLTTLRTLTILAVRCVFQIGEQIDLLLRYLEEATRTTVQYGICCNLTLIARTQCHHFTQDQHLRILRFAAQTDCTTVQKRALTTLKLIWDQTSAESVQSPDIVDALEPVVLARNALSLDAALFLDKLNHPEGEVRGAKKLLSEARLANILKGLIEKLMTMSQQKDTERLELVMRIIAGLPIGRFLEEVWRGILTMPGLGNAEFDTSFNIAMAAARRRPHRHLTPRFMLTTANAHRSKLKPATLRTAVVTAFELITVADGFEDTAAFTKEVGPLLPIIQASPEGAWYSYQIARAALSAGFPEVGSSLIQPIVTQGQSESSLFWLTSLQSIADAFSHVRTAHTSPTPHDELQGAISALWTAHTGIQALEGFSQTPRRFQQEFLCLHAGVLETTAAVIATLTQHESLMIPLGGQAGRATWDALSTQFAGHAGGYEALVGHVHALVRPPNGDGARRKRRLPTHDVAEITLRLIDCLQLFCLLVEEITRHLALGSTPRAEGQAWSRSAASILMYAPATDVSATTPTTRRRKSPFALPSGLQNLVRDPQNVVRQSPTDLRKLLLEAVATCVWVPEAFFFTELPTA